MEEQLILKSDLTQEDYLTYQLFHSSVKRNSNKTRRSEWLKISFFFLFFSIIFHLDKKFILRNISILVAVICFIFLPKILRWYYKFYFTRKIRKSKKRYDYSTIIIVDDIGITTNDEKFEIKIKFEGIQEVHEIEKYYFIYATNELALILKKNNDPNQHAFIQLLEKKCVTLKIPFHRNLNWEW